MKIDCIFCKILDDELPSIKVYEDDNVLAFMDIYPVTKGHVLVIPKSHHDPITETPDDVLQKMIVIAKKIAKAQFKGLDAKGINVTQANGTLAGQMIAHIHIHVIPRYEGDPVPKNWIPGEYKNQDEVLSYASRIIDALKE